MIPLGNVPASTTLYLPFDTYDSNGASVTITGLATTDIEIYKNGSTTQRASDNGYALLDTDGIDFDSTTGLHGFSIDLSDNSDAGFYAAGSQYWVNVNAITVDSQTVRFTYYFRIVAAESTAGTPKVDVSMFGGTTGTFSGGRPEVNTTHAAGTAWASGAITAAAIADGAIDSATFAAGAINNAAVSFDGSELTAIPWNAAWDTEVQSEVQDAIEANHLDHFIAVADPGGVVANSSFLAKLVSKSATPAFSSYDNTTDSLEALRDRGDGAWITATGFSTHSAADVWAIGTRTVTSAANITSTGGTTVPQTGDTFARLGAPVGASHAADIAAIKAETATIVADNPNRPARGVQLSNLPFLMVDATDFATPETGVTVTATISKDGGAFAACTNAAAEIGNGVYKITLTATEMTADAIVLKFTGTGCAQTTMALTTQPT